MYVDILRECKVKETKGIDYYKASHLAYEKGHELAFRDIQNDITNINNKVAKAVCNKYANCGAIPDSQTICEYQLRVLSGKISLKDVLKEIKSIQE